MRYLKRHFSGITLVTPKKCFVDSISGFLAIKHVKDKNMLLFGLDNAKTKFPVWQRRREKRFFKLVSHKAWASRSFEPFNAALSLNTRLRYCVTNLCHQDKCAALQRVTKGRLFWCLSFPLFLLLSSRMQSPDLPLIFASESDCKDRWKELKNYLFEQANDLGLSSTNW